jgi:hypothetical protein
MELETAALQLEALGNPTRLQVYRKLVRAGDAELHVANANAGLHGIRSHSKIGSAYDSASEVSAVKRL